MAKRVKYLKNIESHIEKKYGTDKAKVIMDKALKRYDEIIEENHDEPKSYYMHTIQRIYPAIAVFDAMVDEGVNREEVANFLVDYYKWRSSKIAPMIQKIFKIPGLYKIMPKVFFNMADKNFGPKAGFKAENRNLTKSEMRFDMVKCPYFENCKKYGCVEIVRGFCDADDICYGNMHPKLSWDRTKTLGYGNDVCDFKMHIKE